MSVSYRLVAGLVVGAFLVATLACVCPVGQQQTASQPTVQITQPADGTVVEPGQAVPILAVASDPAGLTRLEVVVDGEVLVTQASPQPTPNLVASTTWSSTTPGSHVIVANAFSAGGRAVQSAPVIVRVQAVSAQGGTSVPPTQPPPTSFPPPTQPPPPPGNRAPVITDLTATPQTVPAGGSVALSVSAYDPDGDDFGYSWDAPLDRGTLYTTDGPGATYTAPAEPSKAGAVTITVIVSDSKGAVATRSVVVTVVRPSGLHDAGPAFQPTWSGDLALQDRLGWAVEAQRDLPPQGANYQAAEQPFERGRMFWYGDVRHIYALYSDDHQWQVFNDTFSWADPAPTALPPTGCTAPTRSVLWMQGGFREVWWNEPNVRARIGCPTQREQGVVGTVQRFQRGVMIQSALNGRVFALFSDDMTWQ